MRRAAAHVSVLPHVGAVGTSNTDPTSRRLYLLGAVAALVAVGFAVIQVTIELVGLTVLKEGVPGTITTWFTLLQSEPLVGVTELTVFQIPLFLALIPVLLALRVALRHVDSVLMLMATTLGVVGVTVYAATNSALTMRALSIQWAAASDRATRSELVAAGQAALGSYQNIGINVGVFLVMSAILIIAVVMLRSTVFSRLTAWVALVTALIALTYYVDFVAPAASIFLLEVAAVSVTVWLLLVGLRLFRLARPGLQ